MIFPSNLELDILKFIEMWCLFKGSIYSKKYSIYKKPIQKKTTQHLLFSASLYGLNTGALRKSTFSPLLLSEDISACFDCPAANIGVLCRGIIVCSNVCINWLVDLSITVFAIVDGVEADLSVPLDLIYLDMWEL